jgi:hypothetical protein
MRSTILPTLLFISSCAFAQTFKVALSPKHTSQLSAIKSGHERMVKFYKYYKRDSVRHVHGQERFHKKQLDSAYRAMAQNDRLRRRLARKGIVMPESIPLKDSLGLELKRWYAVLKHSSSNDSVRREAMSKVKELAVEKASLYPGFQQLQDKYHLKGDSINWEEVVAQVPGLDTLANIYESSPQQLFKVAEKRAENEFVKRMEVGKINAEFAELGELKELKSQYDQYASPKKLEQTGKQKATEEAMDLVAKHADKLDAAQEKVSKLLSKYGDIANSDDLSKAVKRTSMQGRTFGERLVIGGTFNIISTDPLSIDFSPRLGYKFTSSFILGIGMKYRFTSGDSLNCNWYVSAYNTSFNAFASYEVIKGFYGHAEWERSGAAGKPQDLSGKQWTNNYFLGIGKKIKIHPMLYFNTMVLYNLNSQEKNPTYPTRWQFRLGIQLSELATRKERPTYDPNR